MQTQKTQVTRRSAEVEVEENQTITVKFTKLTQATAETLELKAGTTVTDILKEKNIPERAEVRIKRDDKTLTVAKGAELQEGDLVIVIPHSISGGLTISTAI